MFWCAALQHAFLPSSEELVPGHVNGEGLAVAEQHISHGHLICQHWFSPWVVCPPLGQDCGLNRELTGIGRKGKIVSCLLKSLALDGAETGNLLDLLWKAWKARCRAIKYCYHCTTGLCDMI